MGHGARATVPLDSARVSGMNRSEGKREKEKEAIGARRWRAFLEDWVGGCTLDRNAGDWTRHDTTRRDTTRHDTTRQDTTGQARPARKDTTTAGRGDRRGQRATGREGDATREAGNQGTRAAAGGAWQAHGARQLPERGHPRGLRHRAPASSARGGPPGARERGDASASSGNTSTLLYRNTLRYCMRSIISTAARTANPPDPPRDWLPRRRIHSRTKGTFRFLLFAALFSPSPSRRHRACYPCMHA